MKSVVTSRSASVGAKSNPFLFFDVWLDGFAEPIQAAWLSERQRLQLVVENTITCGDPATTAGRKVFDKA